MAKGIRELSITIEASRRGYRLFAPVYDLFFGAGLQHGRRIAIEALDCRPGERILEVCVGTGLSLPLYPPAVQVTGIDVSLEMLRKAARRVSRHCTTPSPILLQMDAGKLAFRDATFDKAAILFAIAGVPDPVSAMAEIQRVCRPGATIVVANHFQSPRRVLRACNVLLLPIYTLLRYRSNLDLSGFVAACGLDVLKAVSANFCGHSTVLMCRRRG